MARMRAVRLLRERKLAELLAPPRAEAVFEASGVVADRGICFVVLDNVRRVARIGAHLRLESADHKWVGSTRGGEGYEAITYSRALGRFYLMVEAQKHPDGTFKGAIAEYDNDWHYKGRRWVDFPLETRNTGFEGLSSMKWRGEHYLLALCEGNGCRRRKKKSKRGHGRIHVLQRHDRAWKPIARIDLPGHVTFKDYAGLALRGDRLAVVSQESPRLWIGRLRPGRWTINGPGRIYEFPRTKKGKRKYFTVEGISWLSPQTLVAVSDLRKRRHPKRSGKTDQSIHVFRLAGS